MFSNIINSWLNFLETGKKSKQSPINIDSTTAMYKKNLVENPIALKYDQKCFEEIKNNGDTFIVSGTSNTGYGQFI